MARREELLAQARTVEEELGRYVQAIGVGGDIPSLVAAARERERQRAHLRQQLVALDGLRDVSQLDVQRIECDLRARVTDWRALLNRQVSIARQIVVKLLGGHRLVFTPREDRAYEFTGRVSFGLLLEGIVLPQVWRPQRDSNPCLGLERATSWASGRWGPEV